MDNKYPQQNSYMKCIDDVSGQAVDRIDEICSNDANL